MCIIQKPVITFLDTIYQKYYKIWKTIFVIKVLETIMKVPEAIFYII